MEYGIFLVLGPMVAILIGVAINSRNPYR